MFEKKIISTPNFDWHCLYSNEPTKPILLMLHGYGNVKEDFLPLATEMAKTYTIVIPDLPFHGTTHAKRCFYTPQDCFDLFNEVLKLNNQTTLSLLSYSMGGRLAMALLNKKQNQIHNIYFLAADGTNKNPISTYVSRFFVELIQNQLFLSRLILKTSVLLNKMGFIHIFLVKFLKWHVEDNYRRACLYNTWHSLTYFKNPISKIIQSLQNHQGKIVCIIGKNDKLIQEQQMNKLRRFNIKHDFYLIQSGHFDIIQNWATDYKKIFN